MVKQSHKVYVLAMALSLWALTWSVPCPVYAEPTDPLNPFEPRSTSITPDDDSDKNKSADDLIKEALTLQQDDRPLDARTKLLKALQKDPQAFEAHLLLADYYLRQVGHFRLALAYTKQAFKLFEAKAGKAPYQNAHAKLLHRDLLSLLSSVRLNLDNYEGALEVLDEYEALGYYESWLPAQRAWVLLKLGRLDEAIRIARVGMWAGAEPGQTMNVLGILLSMTDAKHAAIKILKEAISYEYSLGEQGHPATPLNNVGEVYKEIFEEGLAHDVWKVAMRLPDGCEHVLPSLNLSMLFMEWNDFAGAKQALDGFEACLAQFPLRGGEEHRALVHMARGRIALHTGKIKDALMHLEAAAERQQWFGKIGTNENDLKVAVLVSLAQALKCQNHHLRLTPPGPLLQRLNTFKLRLENKVRAWWLLRRARQILAEDLKDAEDIYIRHTDSMLEYPTLGELLAGYPQDLLEKRLAEFKKSDRREHAKRYYTAYLAENVLAHGRRQDAAELIDQVITTARPEYDAALRTHAQLLKLSMLPSNGHAYINLSYQIFRSARPELRNHGFRLAVNTSPMPTQVQRVLSKSVFAPNNSLELPCKIKHEIGGKEHALQISCEGGPFTTIRAKSPDLRKAVTNLADAVFEIS